MAGQPLCRRRQNLPELPHAAGRGRQERDPETIPSHYFPGAVAAADGGGQALPQQSGSVIPAWGGTQAGQPGAWIYLPLAM